VRGNHSICVAFLLIPGVIAPLASPAQLHAQEAGLTLASGETLTVQGEDFTFEQVRSVVEGEEVLIERAIWEGGVTARFGEIELQTGHVEALFDGPDVTRLEAGPQVVVTGMQGRARFECADVLIDFPTQEAEGGAYTGTCTDVHGYYLANAYELGLEGHDQYEVNFTARVATLSPDTAVLESPRLTLGDLDHPDVAIQSRSMELVIGENPETGNRELLGAGLANLSVVIFGYRLNVVPFRLWRGFVHGREPGWAVRLPRIGWEGDEYLRIDQSATYNFALESVDEGPRLIFRIDMFPFSRSYPEIMADVEWSGLGANMRAGYRREEDEDYNPVPTRAEPEVALRLLRVPVGTSDIGFSARTFWGHLRDMGTGLDLDRWGYSATADHPGIPLGEFRLTGVVDFTDLFYEGGHRYRILDGTVRLRYADAPRWGASMSYRRINDWGLAPFRFDTPQIREEIGLREQTRFSRRWGAGIDWSWNLEEDEFERQELHVTYIFDSFQVSLGWDFADETVRATMGLPGSLR